MRHNGVLGPETCTLCHPEAVLLVDDGQSQTAELHAVLDDGMRTHQHVHRAVGQPLQYFLALLTLHRAREQLHPHGQMAQHGAERLEVLFGQNLGGSHDACLMAVIHSQQHHHESHQCLAASNVALQQTVHLSSALHIGMYLAYDALLGIGQRKGQALGIEFIEKRTHMREGVAHSGSLPLAGIELDAKLYEEEFIELEAGHGTRQLLGRLRVVGSTKGFVERHEAQLAAHHIGQRLGHRLLEQVEELAGKLLEAA